MLYTLTSQKSFKELDIALRTSLMERNFGVLGVHDLKAAMHKKGVSFERDCLVYEVCNPHQAKKVLEAKIDIATALPCRISLWRDGDKTVLSTIKPTALLNMFDVPELHDTACAVEKDLLAAMDEAAKS